MKNKYVTRILAGAVTVAVIGTGAGAYAVHAEKTVETQKEETTEEVVEDTDAEDKLMKALTENESTAEDAGKEETVYVMAKADGTADKVIVSEWLKNKDGNSTLKDASDLKDITNVKGDETFTQSGNEVTWEANGKDIYYQGTTEKELPVTEKVTYYLDGEEMTPEEIAGKSGKVTIRFDYTNHEKQGEVYVPFTVMTGMILPEDYSNVEVTNGKVISDGNKKVVVGLAMPGMKESLGIEEGDLEGDIDIPEYIEVTADVEEFSLDMTMSVIMNELPGGAALDATFDFGKLEDSINTLSDSSKQLVEGSGELAEGLDTLKNSMKEFATGVNTLKSGITSYTNGASEVSSGAVALNSGIDSMSQGVSALTSALGTAMSDSEKQAVAAQADAAVESAFSGGMSDAVAAQAAQQFSATMTSEATVKSIYQGLRYKNDGTDGDLYTSLYSAGCAQKIQEIMAANGVDAATAQSLFAANGGPAAVQAAVEAGLQQAASGIANGIASNGKDAMGASVADACKTAAKTAAEGAAINGAEGAKSQIAAQLQQSGLMDGIAQLKNGASQLAQGSSTLVANNSALISGASALADATSQLTDGIGKLKDGSDELTAGMTMFDEEGIQKLADAYKGDAKALMDKLTEVINAGKDYQTFTKLADGTKGTVKFILRTEAVKEEEK